MLLLVRHLFLVAMHLLLLASLLLVERPGAPNVASLLRSETEGDDSGDSHEGFPGTCPLRFEQEASRNKKLVVTSASLLGTSALLVVTRSY